MKINTYMSITTLYLVVMALVIFVSFPGPAISGMDTPGPRLLWQTEPLLEIPESVLYDAQRHIIYVSNISGSPTDKNGRGFISKLSPEGSVISLKWVTGLNAPKGSGVAGDTLYVADIDNVVKIDIETGRITARHHVEKAEFLNDIAVDSSGTVYISDMSAATSAIYRLKDGRLDVWLTDPEILRPNGLLVVGDRLVVGNSGDGTLKAVHIPSRRIERIAVIGSGIDGIALDGQGNYIISDWKGKTSRVTPSGDITVLLDTTEEKIQAADITVISDRDILLIPTFFDNRVMAYSLTGPSPQ